MTPRRLLALIVLAGSLALPAGAEDYLAFMNNRFPIPERYKLINDHFGVLLISKQIELTKKLQELERRNGTQIIFLSVPNAGKEGARAYGEAVLRQWNIGNNNQGNGALFLVTPTETYINVLPGLGGALPDVKVARIFRDIIGPAWKREAFAVGVEAAIDAMITAAKGEDTQPTFYDYLDPYVPTKPEHKMIAALAAFGVAYGAALLWLRRRKRRRLAA